MQQITLSPPIPVPGVNCHNFTPVNAQEAISTKVLERWKRRNRAAHAHFVEKGTKKNFLGVTELIRRAMDRRVLCGAGVEIWQSRDDSHPRHQHDRYFDYHWPKLERTRWAICHIKSKINSKNISSLVGLSIAYSASRSTTRGSTGRSLTGDFFLLQKCIPRLTMFFPRACQES